MNVAIPPDVVAEVIADETAGAITGLSAKENAARVLGGGDGLYRLIEPYADGGERVLEIGCGNGVGLADLILRGFDAIGIEPGSTTAFEGRATRAARVLQANGLDPARVVRGRGEELPFRDGSFDIVVSAAVIEHVSDVAAVLREAVRVLRPVGVLVVSAPNFDSFYEAHHRLLWLPGLLASKRLASRWVRLCGRPADLVGELNYTNPRMTERLLPGSRTYHVGLGRLSLVTAGDRLLDTGLYERRRRLHLIRRLPTWARATVALTARVVSAAIADLGLAPEFVSVFRKPETPAAM